MVATIGQIIGKINPKVYSQNGKDLLKESGSADLIDADKVKEKPLKEHKLVYDSSSETLEPVYFFILDLMNNFGLETEKLVDNFSSFVYKIWSPADFIASLSAVIPGVFLSL